MTLENGVVLVIILAAAGHVLHRGWKLLAKPANNGCNSGCGSCSANPSRSEPTGFVPAEQLGSYPHPSQNSN